MLNGEKNIVILKVIKEFLQTGEKIDDLAIKFGFSKEYVYSGIRKFLESPDIYNICTLDQIQSIKKSIEYSRMEGFKKGGRSFSTLLPNLKGNDIGGPHSHYIYNRALDECEKLHNRIFLSDVDILFDVKSSYQTVLENAQFYRDSEGVLHQSIYNNKTLKNLFKMSSTNARRDIHLVIKDMDQKTYESISTLVEQKNKYTNYSTKVCMRAISIALKILEFHNAGERISYSMLCRYFNIGKATLNRDINEVLFTINPAMYEQVHQIIEANFAVSNLNPEKIVKK